MFSTPEPFLRAELDYRRERIARDLKAVRRRTRPERRERWQPPLLAHRWHLHLGARPGA